jgi:hypothetical protein
MVVGIEYRKCEDKQRKKVDITFRWYTSNRRKRQEMEVTEIILARQKKIKLGPTIYSMYYNAHGTYLGIYISDLR